MNAWCLLLGTGDSTSRQCKLYDQGLPGVPKEGDINKWVWSQRFPLKYAQKSNNQYIFCIDRENEMTQVHIKSSKYSIFVQMWWNKVSWYFHVLPSILKRHWIVWEVKNTKTYFKGSETGHHKTFLKMWLGILWRENELLTCINIM